MATSPVVERYLTQSELLSTIRRYYSSRGAWPVIHEIEALTGASPSQIKKVSEGLLSAGLADWQGSHLALTGAVFHSPIVTYQLTKAQLDAGPPYPRREDIDMEVQDMEGAKALPPIAQLLAEAAAITAGGGRYIDELSAKYDVLPKTVSNAIFRGRKKLRKAGILTTETAAAELKTKPTPKEIGMPHQAIDTAAAEPESELSQSLAAIKAVADRHCPPVITSLVAEFVSLNLCARCVKRDICPVADYYFVDQVTLTGEDLPPKNSAGRMVFGVRPLLECDWFLDNARVS